jgi:hypothetical protein
MLPRADQDVSYGACLWCHLRVFWRKSCFDMCGLAASKFAATGFLKLHAVHVWWSSWCNTSAVQLPVFL